MYSCPSRLTPPRNIRQQLGNLVKMCNIRKYLMEEAIKTLLVGLVLSHLDYANTILAGIPECDINKMQRIENVTAKLAMKVRKYSSSTTALKKLHWLPIRARRDHNLLTLVYKCLQANALEYLKEAIVEDKPRRDGLWSNSKYKCLHVPRTTRKTFADRSFSTQGTLNSGMISQTNIRKQKMLDTFKSNFKTYLFDKYLDN